VPTLKASSGEISPASGRAASLSMPLNLPDHFVASNSLMASA
jgi:hypothetical protein